MLGSPTITVKGRNLLAKIVADNIPLTLSNIGLGDGLQEENEEVTILANEIMKKEIESCKYSEKEGQYYIRRVFTNADLEEGFYIREVGIYAIDPDEGEILYAYTNAGENGVDYFAPGKGKVIVKEIIEMATKFGNAENITVVIDPSIALVSEKEFEEYKNSNKVNTDNLQKQVTKNTTDLNERMKDILSITKNIQGKNVKFIGDSIVAGYGGTGYLLDGETIYDTYNVNTSGHCWANSLKNYLETNLSCKVKNYGIGGLKSTDIVNHLSDLIKTEDDIILCMIGNNDRKVVNGDTVLYNNLKTIYNYVNNLNKKIIFISQPPCTLEEDALRYLGMDKIENAIMKATSELNIEYISCYKLFIEYMENKNYSLNDLLCSDGSHPNDVGYDVMYYLILSKLGFAKFNSLDSISDSGWINLPLGVAIAGTLEPQYRKVGKLISFRGYFTNISGRSSLVGTLPEGFKPSTVKYLKILSNDTLIAKLQILSNGQIYIQYDANNYASGTYYSLDDAIFLIG